MAMLSRQHRVREEYDRLAEQYDQRWTRYVDTTTDRAIGSLHFAGHERVLDVPCGTGELLLRLRKKWPNLKCAGADLSSRMLEQAEGKHGVSQLELHEACVTSLPLSDPQRWIRNTELLKIPNRLDMGHDAN